MIFPALNELLVPKNKISSSDTDKNGNTNTSNLVKEKRKINHSLFSLKLSLMLLMIIPLKSFAIGTSGNFCQAGTDLGKVHYVTGTGLRYIDMTTGSTSALFSPTSSNSSINNSAYNHEQGLIYYVKDAENNATTSINWFDVHTGTEGLLTANINVNLLVSGYGGGLLSTKSGGGTFLNGHLYFGIDTTSSGLDAFEVIDITVSADGKTLLTATGLTKGQSGSDHNLDPTGSSPYDKMDERMDFGDLGSQIVGGVPYLVGSTGNCVNSVFLLPDVVEACHWSWNLNTNVVKNVQKDAGQFGYSENGKLLYMPNSGNIQEVNVSSTGNLTYSNTSITSPGLDDAAACVAYDYGDAPFMAQTTESTGAKHILTGLRLGTLLDGDVTAHVSADASGDDTTGFDADGTDDDDGVASFDPLLSTTTSYTVNVSCNGGSGTVAGWIDFDGNNTYDANERSNQQSCNNSTATLSWTVPSDIAIGDTFARLRIAPTAAEVANPTGLATGGEVEDYPLTILSSIDAVAETFPDVDGITGGTTSSVLASDTLAGMPITNPALITITQNSSTGGLSLNASNEIVVPTNTPGGSYTLEYTICDLANSAVCDTVVESVNVPVAVSGGPAFPDGTGLSNSACSVSTATNAYQDIGLRWEHNANGGSSPNASIDRTDIFTSATVGTYVGINAQVNGFDLNVNSDTLPTSFDSNKYMQYQFTTGNLGTDDVEMTGIGKAIYNLGDAGDNQESGQYRFAIQVDDDPSFNSPTVLISDVQINNGDTSDVTVAAATNDFGSSIQTFVHIDANGETVPLQSNTTYTMRVYFYAVGDPGLDSSQAYTNVILWDDFMPKVVSCDNSPIVAVDDDYTGTPINGVSGGSTASVVINDTLSGTANPAIGTGAGEVSLNTSGTAQDGTTTLGLGTAPSAGSITMNAAGEVVVGLVTTSGIYQYTYEICLATAPTSCDTAVATVQVTGTPASLPPADSGAEFCSSTNTNTSDYRTAWTYNAPQNTLQPDHQFWPNNQYDTDTFSSVLTQTIGSGLTHSFDGNHPTVIHLAQADQIGAAEANANGDYIEYEFTTKSDITASRIVNGLAFARHDYYSTYNATILISDDNFATATSLLNNHQVNASAGGYEWTPISFTQHMFVEPSTTYKVRVLFHDASSQADVYWDDFHLSIGGCLDYGDAPIATYSEAGHAVPNTPLIYLGSVAPDIEAGTSADDNTVGADEDGVISFPALGVGATSYTMNPSDFNSGTGAGNLYAWIDFDGDGVFETNEFASTTTTASGTVAGALSFTGFTGPSATGTTYARFRVTTDTLTSSDMDKEANDGEVEDYPVTIVAGVESIALVKSVATLKTDADTSGDITLGDTLEYTLTATNDGNVTLTNVVVSDPKLTANSITCATLAPAATCVLTGELIVSVAEADAGEVVNIGGVVSDEITTSVPSNEITTTVETDPALTLVKSDATLSNDADSSTDVTLGDTLSYTVTATNTGNATQNNVVVSDPKLTPASFSCVTLAPSATCVLSGTHVVTVGEADAGEVVNIGGVVSDEITTSVPSNTVTTTVETNPALTLVKSDATLSNDADSSTDVTLGDTLSYTVTATNTGNTTQNNVVVSDPKLTPASFSCVTLAPSASCVLSGTHVVAVSEADAGEVVNIGGVVSDEITTSVPSNTVTTTVQTDPALTLVKSDATLSNDADGSTDVTLGDTLSYTVTATNTGNTTQNNVVVSDPKLTPTSFSCVTLAPSATCVLSGTHVVTSSEATSGEVINIAGVVSDEVTTSVQSNEVKTPVIVEVDLEISKTVNDATPNIGDTITFSLMVENLGPGTANDISVIDIIPAGFTYVTGTMTGGFSTDESSPTGTGLKWVISTLTAAPGVTSNTTLTFQVVVNAP